MSAPTDLASRLDAVYTAALADVLDRRGMRTQTLPPDLVPLRSGMRVAGPVYPIKGRAAPGADYDVSIRTVLEMLGSVPAGHVSVYESGDRESAHLGELSVISLKSRGVAGAVIDGGCRDVELMLREGFPVFSRYTTPQDGIGRWEVVAHGDVEIEIGGVRLSRGDWILADADGIVAIPAAVAPDVVAEAEEKVATENAIRVAIRAGTTPLDAFERYGTF
ncbi:MAG TPA: RraA family protein [Gaiellaceae bacterium]|nr:RraA family protein [Gaiellaceae bacterium]